MMMKKNDQSIKMKKIYGSGLMLMSLLVLISMKAGLFSAMSQDLEAPVPSITIEEEGGLTTSFGELSFEEEEDLPPIPSKEETSGDKKSSDPTRINKDEQEDDIKAIGDLSDSSGDWDSWEITEVSEESTPEGIQSTAQADPTGAIQEDDAEVDLSLEIEEPTKTNEESPIAVGTIKDQEGNDLTPAPTQTPKTVEATPSPQTSGEQPSPDIEIDQDAITIADEEKPKVTMAPAQATKTEPEDDIDLEIETESNIVAAPEAPTPPAAERVNPLATMDPPTVSTSENISGDPSLEDLPLGALPTVPMAPMDRDENREVEIAKLISQLEEEAANKEVAKSSLVPNQMQDEINFDNVPIGAAFRLLAEQAGFNFVEPPFQDGETLSLRFQKMTPLDAFMKIAQARGFAVVTENGFTTLKRPDITLPEFFEVKKYRLKYIQPKWIIQSVANLLEIQIQTPGDTLASFPEPSADATSYGGSNDGNSGGGGGTTTAGATGNNGSQNIGLPTAPRWTSSLPYDEPLHTGDGGAQGGGEVPFIFIDRSSSSLVVKTTKEKQKMVAQYIANVDKPEPQIMIETKVVEIAVGDILRYGTDYADALGQGITVNWEGARVNLADVFSGAGAGAWSAFLTIPETSITIRAFQEMAKGSVMNMPRTMTRSGVPVSISSTITDATPSYQVTAGSGVNGTQATPSGYNTFTTGLTIDLVPTILENGMVDININPSVANKVGDKPVKTPDGGESTIPIISSRSLTTSAVVPSGMTIMLGGIVETTNTESGGGIPILSRVPVLGKTLFGNNNKTDSRKTLIIFVTPKLVYPDEYQQVWTDEEEWRAMIDGNRVDIQTLNERIPQPLEIRKAMPIKDTLRQGTTSGRRK